MSATVIPETISTPGQYIELFLTPMSKRCDLNKEFGNCEQCPDHNRCFLSITIRHLLEKGTRFLNDPLALYDPQFIAIDITCNRFYLV